MAATVKSLPQGSCEVTTGLPTGLKVLRHELHQCPPPVILSGEFTTLSVLHGVGHYHIEYHLFLCASIVGVVGTASIGGTPTPPRQTFT